jgi:hypothetical protein
MANSNKRQSWDGQQLPPYLLEKQEESSEVYELSPKKGAKFFNYLGMAFFACAIAGGLYFAASWLFHLSSTRHLTSDHPVAAKVVGAPTVKAVPKRPAEIGYVGAWGISSSGATISWSTNVPATTLLSFGTSSALGQNTEEQKKLVVAHGVTLQGLNSGTTYYFVARSIDKDGVTGSSGLGSFTTKSVEVPPVISSIVVEPGNKNEARISWTTSKPAYSYFEAGANTSYGHWSTKTDLTTSAHCSINWVPGGQVHYHLVSTDAQGNKTVSPDFTFVEP